MSNPWLTKIELGPSEQLLNAFFAASPAGLTIVDSEFRFVWINQTLAEIDGPSVEEHLGKTVREMIPQLAGTVEPFLHRIFTTGQPVLNVEITGEVPSQPGIVRHWVASHFPIPGPEGSILAAGILVVEITAIKHAKEDLRKQTEILQKIFDHAPVMISFAGEDDRIKLVNPEWERVLGWSQEEIEKQEMGAECDPDRQRLQDVLEFLTAADGKWTDFRTKTGDGRIIDTTSSRVRLSDGTSICIGKDITERKQAERELREQKNRAQMYLDIAGVMLLALNPNQEVVLVNRRACEILGYTKEEIIGKRWCDNFIPARDRDWLNRAFAQLVAEDIDPVEYVENPVLRKTGKERLIAWHNTLLRDESGKIVATLSSGEDITERKRAEEELRRAEQEYRHIFNDALEGIYRVSPERGIVAANPALARMLGYDSAQDALSSVTDTAHQIWANPEERLRFVGRLEQGEIIRAHECQFVRKDGTKIWVSLSSRKVEGSDGKTLYFEGFIEDITERKRADEDRSLLASIVESSEDFIIAKDLNGIILSWNRAAERMYGWTAEEVVGKSVGFLFPPDRAKELDDILAKIRAAMGSNTTKPKG